MINITNTPKEVIEAYCHYCYDTGETVWLREVIIGDDGKAFLYSVHKEDDTIKMSPIYLTGDIHGTVNDRMNKDEEKVTEFFKELSIEMNKATQLEVVQAEIDYEDEEDE